MSVLPLWLQFVADYKLLMYGLLLFAVMRFSPGGIDSFAKAAWRRLTATGGGASKPSGE